MRTLPKNKTEKQKIIINAVYDYYGKEKNLTRANQVALFIMGRKRGVTLTKEEESDLWAIKTNMSDETYFKGLTIAV